MSGNHTSTTNHNKDFLIEKLNLTRYRNSTIFVKKDYFVLSPSIQNEQKWFDIRKVNLDKFEGYKYGKLLIRLFDDFILVDLNEFISELIDDNPFVTTNSGIHWKFKIRGSGSNIYILNTKSKRKLFVQKTDKNGVLSKF